MTDPINFFTADNIISTLSIVLDETFNIELYCYDQEVTPIYNLFIAKEGKSYAYLSTSDYKNCHKQTIYISLKTIVSAHGIIKPLIEIEHLNMAAIVERSNLYVEVFMKIFDIDEITEDDLITLILECKYEVIDNTLVLVELSCRKTLLIRYLVNNKSKHFDLEFKIDSLLKPLEIDCINRDTNIEHVVELIKMKFLVEDMEQI